MYKLRARTAAFYIYNTSQCHHEHTLAPNETKTFKAAYDRRHWSHVRTGLEVAVPAANNTPHADDAHTQHYTLAERAPKSTAPSWGRFWRVFLRQFAAGPARLSARRASRPLCVRASSLFRQLGTEGERRRAGWRSSRGPRPGNLAEGVTPKGPI